MSERRKAGSLVTKREKGRGRLSASRREVSWAGRHCRGRRHVSPPRNRNLIFHGENCGVASVPIFTLPLCQRWRRKASNNFPNSGWYQLYESNFPRYLNARAISRVSRVKLTQDQIFNHEFIAQKKTNTSKWTRKKGRSRINARSTKSPIHSPFYPRQISSKIHDAQLCNDIFDPARENRGSRGLKYLSSSCTAYVATRDALTIAIDLARLSRRI